MPRNVRNAVDSMIEDLGADTPETVEALRFLADTIDARDAELSELRDDLHALSNRIGAVTEAVGAHDRILAERGEA